MPIYGHVGDSLLPYKALWGCLWQLPPNKWLAALDHWFTALPWVCDVTD